MSDDIDTKSDAGQKTERRPLSLRRTEKGAVKQSFSHGRTKVLMVEKVKRRTVGPHDVKAAPAAAANVALTTAAIAYAAAMVCPDYQAPLGAGSSCVELAGASPVAVSAEAPRSRLQSSREIAASKRSVKSPRRGVCLGRGEQSRRPNPKG